jgi:hypothetical protein
MRNLRTGGVLVAVVALGGCCCRPPPCAAPCAAGPATIAATPPGPRYEFVHEAPAPAKAQIFLETSIYRLGKEAGDALAASGREGKRMSSADAKALEETWRSSPAVEALAMPKVLQLEGEDATMFTGEATDAVGITEPEHLGRAGVSGVAIRTRSRVTGEAVALNVRAGWKENTATRAVDMTVTETVGPEEAWVAWTAALPDSGERVALVIRAKRLAGKT